MNKLLSANFARLKKDTALKLCIIFMFVMGVLLPFMNYRTMTAYDMWHILMAASLTIFHLWQ